LITIKDGSSSQGTDHLKIKEIQQAAAGCVSRKKVMITE
jgi:hypothetical protein